jgi:HrpA-like RNA helicase
MKTLVFIGAFDLRNQLTPLGAQMAKFPLEPAHACAVLTARAYGPAVLSSVISIVSILSCTSKLFLDPSDPAAREEASEARKKFRHPSGDHLTRLNALNAYIEAATAGSKNERKRWCKDNFVNERTCVEAINIREQVTRVAGKLKIQSDHGANDNGGGQSQVEEGVLRSLTAGYATNTAFLQPDGTYKQLIGLSVSDATIRSVSPC